MKKIQSLTLGCAMVIILDLSWYRPVLSLNDDQLQRITSPSARGVTLKSLETHFRAACALRKSFSQSLKWYHLYWLAVLFFIKICAFNYTMIYLHRAPGHRAVAAKRCIISQERLCNVGNFILEKIDVYVLSLWTTPQSATTKMTDDVRSPRVFVSHCRWLETTRNPQIIFSVKNARSCS